jgi:pantoate--beta-alanine ligase
VTVEGISSLLEGEIRPGHFRGVATVVAKLFHIVKPHTAYFGQKDFQQCAVIKRMVAGLDMDVRISVLPTVREQDGLAMSSRNSYLSPEERRKATVLYRALSAARDLFQAGTREPGVLTSSMHAVLQSESGVSIDYAVVADPDTLAPLTTPSSRMVFLVAARLGKTRLIDNLVV